MSSTRTPQERHKLIQEHQEAILRLEAEEVAATAANTWPPQGFYLIWHLVVGVTLGGLGPSSASGSTSSGRRCSASPRCS